MATSSAVDTNIGNLPPADQARTDITTSGTTTTVTVDGKAPLKDLVVEVNPLAPSVKLDGNFKNITVTGNTETKETISVGKGDKVSKSLFDLGKDDIKDTIKFSKSAKAKKLQIAKDRKSTRLNSSHSQQSRMPSSA